MARKFETIIVILALAFIVFMPMKYDWREDFIYDPEIEPTSGPQPIFQYIYSWDLYHQPRNPGTHVSNQEISLDREADNVYRIGGFGTYDVKKHNPKCTASMYPTLICGDTIIISQYALEKEKFQQLHKWDVIAYKEFDETDFKYHITRVKGHLSEDNLTLLTKGDNNLYNDTINISWNTHHVWKVHGVVFTGYQSDIINLIVDRDLYGDTPGGKAGVNVPVEDWFRENKRKKTPMESILYVKNDAGSVIVGWRNNTFITDNFSLNSGWVKGTGSMRPVMFWAYDDLQSSSLTQDYLDQEVMLGDIITFDSPWEEDQRIIHRVITINGTDIWTKGDNNYNWDKALLNRSWNIHKVFAVIYTGLN